MRRQWRALRVRDALHAHAALPAACASARRACPSPSTSASRIISSTSSSVSFSPRFVMTWRSCKPSAMQVSNRLRLARIGLARSARQCECACAAAASKCTGEATHAQSPGRNRHARVRRLLHAAGPGAGTSAAEMKPLPSLSNTLNASRSSSSESVSWGAHCAFERWAQLGAALKPVRARAPSSCAPSG
jgi:hypothetical protein